MPPNGRCCRLPLLPLRGLVVLPGTELTLQVGRPASLRAVDDAMAAHRRIVLAAQKEENLLQPALADVHRFAALGEIRRTLRDQAGNVSLVVRALQRVRIVAGDAGSPHRVCVEPIDDTDVDSPHIPALRRAVLRLYDRFAQGLSRVPGNRDALAMLEDPGRLADLIGDQATSDLNERQALLATASVRRRLERVCEILKRELSARGLEAKIEARVRRELERSYRELYLRERLKIIRQELGEQEPTEVEAYRRRVEAAAMPADIRERALRELERMDRMPPLSAEAVIVRGYLDWILSLPWGDETTDVVDLGTAEQVLEADHYGLAEVKDRILDYLAVRQLAPGVRTPILCLVGPPGTGKTSLARSIAQALGRRFARIALGGVHDEAEIRGHRRTYVGALPGRIIQGLRQAGTRNPVFLLDEIDKLGGDYRGDPAAALLEALDPEQNHAFSDHYLEAPFDLSRVLFVATANVTHTIPRTLLDRMEIIPVPGYSDEEKLAIAARHLLPRQLAEHGLDPARLRVSPGAMAMIVRDYTLEAGVRALDRQLARICRKAARRLVTGDRDVVRVTRRNLAQYLGRPRLQRPVPERRARVGVVVGLAWMRAGGQVLPIEVAALPGSGALTLTGQLGDVMQESARAAVTYVRSRSAPLGLPGDFAAAHDLHIHVPEGAVPKDGPSAGLPLVVGLVSALTGRPVRGDLALTGEITLHGRVLPVGGVKEKVLAAYRHGLRAVVLPSANRPDLDDVPGHVRRRLELFLADHVDDILDIALAGPAPA
ncbi:MAG TPA: endopeptidase La [Bacillota bacterium]